jgi:hypothetical protein
MHVWLCVLSLGAYLGRLDPLHDLGCIGVISLSGEVLLGAWVASTNIHPSILMPLICEENLRI